MTDHPPKLRVVAQKRTQALPRPLPGRMVSDRAAQAVHDRVIAENRVLDEISRVRADWVECLDEHYRTPEQWLTLMSGRVGVAADRIAAMTNPDAHRQACAIEAMTALVCALACGLEVYDRLKPSAQAGGGPDG